MSDAGGRLPRVALALAAAALAIAVVAAVVVLERGDRDRAPAAATGIEAHEAAAPDLVKLGHAVEWVATGSALSGVRVTDPELERALGLHPGDRIYALAGRRLAGEADVGDAIYKIGTLGATFIDVDVSRAGELAVVRWRIVGDLRAAHLGGRMPWLAPDPPDPLLGSIVRTDDHHVVIPRATFDQLLADPAAFARSARVVPAVTAGVTDGFKLYAIRPASVFARLGLQNGDTIRAVNGFELTSPDQALDLVRKVRRADQLTVDLERRGHAEILTITIK
jgi:membrane-associated protease RseP (regulator of RpoE activity)